MGGNGTRSRLVVGVDALPHRAWRPPCPTSPRPFADYAAVLTAPGVRVPVLGTAPAALSIGLLGLAVLPAVERAAGGFAVAGAVGALLGIGTGVGIAVQGRLMDRFGHPPVLLTAAVVQALALVGLVAAIRGGSPPGNRGMSPVSSRRSRSGRGTPRPGVGSSGPG